MRRKMYGLVSLLSLLICVGTVVLWVRSYWVGDYINYQTAVTTEPLGRKFYLGINEGECIFSYQWEALNPTWREDAHFSFNDQPIGNPIDFVPPPRIFPALAYGDEYSPGSYRYRTLTMPLWLIATLMVCPPAWRFSVLWRHHRRRAIGRTVCRNCGYDLTGNTSGICPECGTAVAGKARA